MPSRFRSAALSLLAVTGCYWLYALLAVPFIEPTVNVQAGEASTAQERNQAALMPENLSRLLSEHFPPGHWAHDNAMVFQSLRGLLLIHEYKPRPDGKVKIEPCAMILFPKPFEGDGPTPKRTIVLEAPQGALLTFDEGFDLASGKFGQFTSGYLPGEITIRSEMDHPGPEDDLLIVTQEVHMDAGRIWTPHAVNFRLGRSQGGGRDLSIRLSPAPIGKSRSPGTPNIGGIESFELGHDVEVYLDLGDKHLFSSRQDKPLASATPRGDNLVPPAGHRQSKPVQISCRGAFRFNLIEREATFDDHVDVFQSHPNAPSDHMSSQEMTIFFEPKDRDRGGVSRGSTTRDLDEEDSGGLPALEPVRIRATGNPVVVESPVNQGRAEGEVLEYDLRDETISLKLRNNRVSRQNGNPGFDASRYVYLLRGSSKAYARELIYWPAKIRGGLGAMEATGPGLINLILDEKEPEKQVVVRWNNQLSLRRVQGEQTLKITGQPDISLADVGRIVAGEEFRLWLVEPGDKQYQAIAERALRNGEPQRTQTPLSTQQKTTRQTALPTRMQAIGGVRILDSDRLEGQVGELRMWFSHRAAPPETGQRNKPERQSLFAKQDEQGEKEAKKYTLDGQRLEIQTVFSHRDGKIVQTEVAGLNLDAAMNTKGQIVRAAQFLENNTSPPAEQPLRVVGARIELKQTDSAGNGDESSSSLGQPNQITVSGAVDQPAHIEARGLTIDSRAVHLDRETNRLFCDQPGRITMLVKKDLKGRDLPAPQNLIVNWRRAMNFDGRTVRFEGEVVAQAKDQELRTNEMAITLTDRVDFNSQARSEKVDLQVFECRGGVLLESRAPDERGKPTFDRLYVGLLQVNQQTGEIFAQPPPGQPGWLKSTRFGGGFDKAAASPTGTGATQPANDRQDELQYLFVRFHREARGRIDLRELTLYGEVRTLYGPVANWDEELDPEAPTGPGPKEMTLDCDQLKIAEMPAGPGGDRSIELKAIGNVEAEFEEFTAFATEMTYAQAKEKITLKGPPSNKAVIHYKAETGAKTGRHSAAMFEYWRNTRALNVSGGGEFQALETGAR